MSFRGPQPAAGGTGRPAILYLDHQATTPLDPRVLDVMLPWFTEKYGNAASYHSAGREAAAAAETARHEVAQLIGGAASRLVFTSGATEANNAVFLGLALAGSVRRRVVSVVTEHPSVLEPLDRLRTLGWDVQLVGVDSDGVVDVEEVAEVVDAQTALVSIMAANNEVGALAPLAELAEVAHGVGSLFHTDATQLVGKLPISVDDTGIDLLSLSAHKFYGPKGVGALYVGRAARGRIAPLLLGGGHEVALRSGTINVPGCVGMGCAAAIAAKEQLADAERLGAMAARLLGQLNKVGGVRLNGPATGRLPGNLNVCIDGVEGEDVLLRAPTVAASTGSACSSASPRPSHVLLAMGRTHEEAGSAVRFGVGRFSTEADVDAAAAAVVEAVRAARSGGGPR